SYNNWVKKHKRSQIGTAAAADHAIRITVQVSVAELGQLLMSGGKSLPIKIESILAGLPAAERRQLAEWLGNQRLARVQAQHRPTQDDQADMHDEAAQV